MCYKMITADKCLMFSVLLSQVTSIFGAVNVANNKPTRQSTINLGVNTSSWAGLTAWWCIDLRQEFHINTVKISKPIHDDAGCAGCGPLPHKLNAFVENSQAMHPVGANRNYTCIKGAYVKGSPFAHCLPSGEWDIQSFTCKIARTCHDAHKLGIPVSPSVVIRPDVKQSPLTVSCEVSDNGVYTVIGHGAKRTYVHGYETIRSYNGSINYNIDLQQVINIVDASAECEQFIKFECFHVETFSSVGLSTRTGQLATYLMGGVKGQMGCACHISKTCVDGLKCNCDKNDDRLRVDEGYIRYKEDLPITAVLVGDTGNDKEYAYYTVGNLRCKG
ncbi:contactin-associated protein 1 isoform X3 [Patella vulgata]|uniref:contactin-associated protein 1 isoform X3 n=1 Tax=Patella vulgata TaxID=6465 RepID=UPI0024A9C2C5|nr:contactin-associated protein 1 isoform X3 [Patella vulgata]